MSRIGKLPITVPEGVEINISDNNLVSVKGKLGELQQQLHKTMKLKLENGTLTIDRPSESKEHKSLHGLSRALINNMVIGVTEGYSKQLQLVGVGYRAQMQGNVLDLSLGFSHPVKYSIPQGITIETPSQTEINVKGADKQKVGQVCAEIRAYRPPEPYKGKGVRYSDERVIRKEAKKK